MSVQQPGERYSVVATKAVTHKNPAVENNHPGIALKSAQPAPMVPTTANATTAQQIAVGEEMVIALTGAWPVDTTLLPAGAAVGDPLYIRVADNVLVNQAEAAVDPDTTGAAGPFAMKVGYRKYGVISSIDTTLARSLVNLNLRSTF